MRTTCRHLDTCAAQGPPRPSAPSDELQRSAPRILAGTLREWRAQESAVATPSKSTSRPHSPAAEWGHVDLRATALGRRAGPPSAPRALPLPPQRRCRRAPASSKTHRPYELPRQQRRRRSIATPRGQTNQRHWETHLLKNDAPPPLFPTRDGRFAGSFPPAVARAAGEPAPLALAALASSRSRFCRSLSAVFTGCPHTVRAVKRAVHTQRGTHRRVHVGFVRLDCAV